MTYEMAINTYIANTWIKLIESCHSIYKAGTLGTIHYH
jgi:hypothetical protein